MNMTPLVITLKLVQPIVGVTRGVTAAHSCFLTCLVVYTALYLVRIVDPGGFTL